ncbi:MAG: hypothetical protein ACQESF_02510 [Nanobdellota archaeon]
MLDDHFLKYFSLTQEPFVVFDNILYTIERKNNSENSFTVLNQSFDLEKGESISNLEKKLLQKNEGNVQNIINSQINKAQSDFQKHKNELEKLKRQSEQLKVNDVERFILVDVLNDYYKTNKTYSTTAKKTGNFPKTDIGEMPKAPGLDLIYNDSSAFNDIIKSPGFLCMQNTCYQMQPTISPDSNKGYVTIGKKHFNLKPWKNLEELSKLYSNRIKKKIKSHAIKHEDKIKNEIKNLSEFNKSIQNELNKPSSKGILYSDDALTLEKLSNNRYELRQCIKPFIMGRTFNGNPNYYVFSKCELFVHLKVQKDQIRIENVPKVASKYIPYDHPFVFKSKEMQGDICYDNYKWKQKKDIEFKKPYTLDQRTARRITDVLRKGKFTLEKGYTNEKLTPVIHPEKLNCKIATNREDALNYARRHNIPEYRIIENG